MPTDPFVDVEVLPSLGVIRYLDVRDQAEFDAARAPGAERVPVEVWDAAAKAEDAGFEKTAYWDDAFRSLGVDPSSLAVVYDGGRMTDAARVWFILLYFGAKGVIVNGGWSKMATMSVLPAGAEPSTKGSPLMPWHRGCWAGRSADSPRAIAFQNKASNWAI